MFVARVKFEIQTNDFYESDKIYFLYENAGVRCTYRLIDEDTFEFVLSSFDSKEEAFEKGKILYSNLIFLLNRDLNSFYLEIKDFSQERLCSSGKHLNRRVGQEGEEPDKFYYSNQKFFNNNNCLEIFEIKKDFYEEYDAILKERIKTELVHISDHNYHFEKLQKLNIPYSQDVYNIYKILDLCNKEDEISIKILILSIAIETMANFELSDVLKRCEESANLDDKDNKYLKEFTDTEKELSVKKKCRLFIQRYAEHETKALKTFNNLYNLRSAFTHGNDISKRDDVYKTFFDGKNLILDLLKAKYST